MSKIEVNEIDAQSGNTITVGSACKSVAFAGNIVKSNALQASDGGNIVSQSGSTITLGASGDTIALSAGASQLGFGREGSVDWQTGSVKTATFTAASGEGYFCNTTGGVFTCNLPAGSAGSIVSLADYAGTWQTNNLTITPNGSQKIGAQNVSVTLNTEGQSVTFVYVDDTQGWLNVQDSTSNERGSAFITATGGTITTSGDCKIHTFTGPGTFCVSGISNTPDNNAVGYLVVAGGGGGGAVVSGGGGGGGFREGRTNPVTPYTASPLVTTGLTVAAQAYPITVGSGGTGGTPPASNTGARGGNSIFSSITSTGGGGAGNDGASGLPGGSGGGRLRCSAGNGNTPPVSPPQGNNGGDGSASGAHSAGGGGGATAVGQTGTPSPTNGGNGGAGATTHIYGSPKSFSGGGGGSATVNPGQSSTGGNGGLGGGGGASFQGSNPTGMQGGAGFNPGANGATPSGNNGGAGGANSGGGGGGGSHGGTPNCGGAGGSGIVIIRYKFQ